MKTHFLNNFLVFCTMKLSFFFPVFILLQGLVWAQQPTFKKTFYLSNTKEDLSHLTLDAQENLYVLTQSSVFVFNAEGKEVTHFKVTNQDTDSPQSICVTQKNELWVVNRGYLNIYDLTGKFLKTSNFMVSEKNLQGFKNAKAICMDNEGMLYVLDITRNQVYKITDGGEVKEIITVNTEFKSETIGVDAQKQLYFPKNTDNSILVTDANGKTLNKVGKKGKEDGGLSLPTSVAVDAQGRIWVLDMTKKVTVYDAKGKFLFVLNSSELENPSSIFIRKNNIYIADKYTQKVCHFTY